MIDRMELAVETHGLTRDFGSFRAVDGVDLAVPAGSFYGFLGPNGAGKSTTIKCLTGLLPPTAGTMRILGIDPLVDPVAVKRRIGVVPEDLALFDRLTAARDAALHRPGAWHRRGDRDEPVGGPAAADGAETPANTLVTDFSHGMRKKLSLAAALLPAPRLLFLDEPFEGIDAVASRQIKDLLLSFVARGGTIFLTSHILEIVERLSTHIGVIARGGSWHRRRSTNCVPPRQAARRSKSCSSRSSAAKRGRSASSTGSDRCSGFCARSRGCGGACS